jgi:uncharacterized protein
MNTLEELENITREYPQIINVLKQLKKFIIDNGIDETHGYEHATTVTMHSYNVLKDTTIEITNTQKLWVILASLLHDVDDSKYFSTKNYENCVVILSTCGFDVQCITNVVHMISLVSCSKNGNSTIDDDELWKLIPRLSDRLESTGIEGARRCFYYNTTKGKALYNETTPRPTTREEALNHATEERFANYLHNGTSSTMMDHYFDKMIHVAFPPRKHVEHSKYFMNEFEKRVNPLLDVCVHFGIHGEITENVFT